MENLLFLAIIYVGVAIFHFIKSTATASSISNDKIKEDTGNVAGWLISNAVLLAIAMIMSIGVSCLILVPLYVVKVMTGWSDDDFRLGAQIVFWISVVCCYLHFIEKSDAK